MIRKHWWKITGALLVLYSLYAGLVNDVPRLAILNETIRNIYFHVPMWFTMMFLYGVSMVYSIIHLSGFELKSDTVADYAARTGMAFGLLGLFTGMIWANFTWGAFWISDTKLNGSAATLLVYAAYFVLRNSVEDEQKRARISAVYNIFAFVLMLVFIMVLPRLTDSLHPGNGGNPAFASYDLDNHMRLVFYPAVTGWILMGLWIMQLQIRIQKIKSYLQSL
jgi:heme exporter protein C